jgi:DNA-binding response OmpR family regulator
MKQATILVVEDEKLTADFINLVLTNAGYSVAGIIPSGKEAIDIALKIRPDLILLDIDLEGKIDGFYVCEQIRKVANIPIVFVSVNAHKESFALSMECQPAGFIVKPFKIETLLTVVKSALDLQVTVSE